MHMEQQKWQFGVWRGAWYFADAVTMDQGEIYPWFSENAWYLYAQAHIHADEAVTRLPDVWSYYPEVAG
jgi:hypothetical protein